MKTRTKKVGHGFTILELVIVMIVITLLSAAILALASGVFAKGRDSERKADLREIKSKAAEYYASYGYYPVRLSDMSDLPAENCKAPGGSGTCSSPDYTYKAFKSGTATATSSTADCDNATNYCATYIVYTPTSGAGAMEKISNPFSITN